MQKIKFKGSKIKPFYIFFCKWKRLPFFLILILFLGSGEDGGAGRDPSPCKEIVFPVPPLTIFIFVA